MDQAKQLKADLNGSGESTTLALKPPDKETPTHVPPLQPGWLVVYRNRQGALCGGADDREHGTVTRCAWNGIGWAVYLTDGQQLSLSLIQAVRQTTGSGQFLAAWRTREHGFDGHGRR